MSGYLSFILLTIILCRSHCYDPFKYCCVKLHGCSDALKSCEAATLTKPFTRTRESLGLSHISHHQTLSLLTSPESLVSRDGGFSDSNRVIKSLNPHGTGQLSFTG